MSAQVAVRIIRDEHLAIASVLYSLRSQIRQLREHAIAPNFPLLHAILDYVVVFPEKLHHPKEDRFLFQALLERCPESRELIAELEAEHRLGATMIENLKTTLVDYSRRGEDAFPPFAQAVEAYVAFHWRHMTREEDKILPLAERHLSTEDWTKIAAAFAENDNPLFGIKPREQNEILYRKILSLSTADPARTPLSPRSG